MAGKVMKAVQYSNYGGGAASLKHVTIPVPVPKEGEFLVKIEAADVNRFDLKIQDGLLRPLLPRKFPFIPGHNIAGEVVSVGDNVTGFAVGDKIVAVLDENGGSLAEYVVITARSTAVKRPPEVSAVDGACLAGSGMSGLQVLKNSGVTIDGSYTGNVLLIAATGGVGVYAVQLAKLFGAHVTATVEERNMELMKELGADEVLDYKTPEGASLISPSGKKYDVIVNASGVKWSVMQPQLSPTGIVQELNLSLSTTWNSVVKKVTGSKKKRSCFILSPNDKDLGFMIDLIAQGKIETLVEAEFPLDKAEEAWAKTIQGDYTGKVIVTE